VDHRTARPGHQEGGGRGRPAAAFPFDKQDLAKITSGGRLVACRNPVLAAERARKR
jgi:hypothetical protein